MPSHITIYILSIINTQELIRRPSIQRELIAERENLLGKISEYVQNERKAFQVWKRGCTAHELNFYRSAPFVDIFNQNQAKRVYLLGQTNVWSRKIIEEQSYNLSGSENMGKTIRLARRRVELDGEQVYFDWLISSEPDKPVISG